jgi:hypothetical protein
VYAYNPATLKDKNENQNFEGGLLGLQREFKAILGKFVRLCLTIR